MIPFNILQKIIKQFLRKNSNYNKLENQKLTIEYLQKYKKLKDFNAQALLKTHYIPKAREIILRESGFLLTENLVLQRAGALMNIDIANGVLDEFCRFRDK